MVSESNQLSCGDYHIAWICPVADTEFLPARLMLDEEHPTPPYDTYHDENLYICGSINGHAVVVATCPQGLVGDVNAGRLSGPMFKTFPNIHIALLIGIGGGVPRAEVSEDSLENVHLGDVVVGWPGDGKPACVYHDRGRSKVEGQFGMVGVMQDPDWRLTIPLSMLVSEHDMGNTRFDDQLARLQKPKTKFAHPGLEHDLLFKPTHHHIGDYKSKCILCDKNELLKRPQRSEEERHTFVFHRGRIATGNAFIQDAQLRDVIRTRCDGALCIETEAAGIDVNRRCLVIHGISDYADSHKSDVWRYYAAGKAAAFARELLCRVPPDTFQEMDISESDHTQHDIQTLEKGIQNLSKVDPILPDSEVGADEQTNAFHIGDYVNCRGLDKLKEGPYLVAGMSEAGKYTLTSQEGHVLSGGDSIPERHLVRCWDEPISRNMGTIENTLTTVDRTSQASLQLTSETTDAGTVPEQHLNPGTDDPDSKVISYWETIARLRAEGILADDTHSGDSLSLREVIQYRVWPFYKNWLHQPLGPCTRTAEFDWHDRSDATSVKIYITCNTLPKLGLQEIIRRYTHFLVPMKFESGDQVEIIIDEGTTTRSCSANEIINTSSELVNLKMGDGISSVSASVYGSSGPWLRTASNNVFLYTNEHVVRQGVTSGQHLIQTYPGLIHFGEVALYSQGQDDATMECNNPEVDSHVRNDHDFIADWALVKFEQAPTNPVEMPIFKGQKPCIHINDIIHIPRKGYAVARGAAVRKQPGERLEMYYNLRGDGIPTVHSPKMWGTNTIELACWSLSQSRLTKDDDWWENGIGQAGDSGTGVVDCKSGLLCGLIIGQTQRKKSKSRTAYMIDLMDVVEDTIRASPTLPHVADFNTAKLIQCSCNLQV